MKPIPDKEWLTPEAARLARAERRARWRAALPAIIVVCLFVAAVCLTVFVAYN